MSERPCPDETTIISILYSELAKQFAGETTTDKILKTISDVFVEFGGVSKVGSMSGWNMFAKRELLDRCVARLRSDPFAIHTTVL
jgi:hypothetical protein